MRRRSWFRLPILLPLLSLLFAAATGLRADAPAFDLIGPKVDVHVQRDGKTLPIAEVPNLLPGDRLWIHPDLPESQSTHYILIIAFLRGATNPPPVDWYRRVETWTKEVREEGVFVVVPPEAQQALIFLAPETTGDFSTLRKAVHDRPGAFVRAAQDLQLASWDRMRLDAYLAEVKTISAGDPKGLKEKTALAARSLGIRVDQQCFDKPTDQQAPCLVQHTDGLVLDDSNAQSIVTQMANNGAADMMNQLSYTPLAGAGAFSPYVGAVVDLARILSTVHTAKYQYIPALALPQKEQGDTLNLRLNVPPSFRDPKSVIVIALPPISPSHAPQLHPPDVAQNTIPNYCATKPGLALVVEGAPLAFATDMAHELTLHIETKAHLDPSEMPHAELTDATQTQKGTKLTPAKSGAATAVQGSKASSGGIGSSSAANAAEPGGIDVPIHPAPSEGGFVLDHPLPPLPEDEVVAQIRGKWGFDSIEGPKFHLRAPHPGGWTLASADSNALITGREDTVHLQGASTLCIEDVQAKVPEGHDRSNELKVPWKSPKPDQLELAVPMKDASPGTVTLAIRQYGLAKPDELPLKSYSEGASLDHITLSAGDKTAVLKGRRLDEVESADLNGIQFTPGALARVGDFDELSLNAKAETTALQVGGTYSAKVTLKDGRNSHVASTVTPSRPQVELLSKGVQHDDSGSDASSTPVHFGSDSDLPLQKHLVFFLRSKMPVNFGRTEKIELAATDGSFSTTLSLTDGSLVLEDAHTAVATVDPMARFGASAFGAIQLRAVTAEGIAGDWVPVGTLVRLPLFKDLKCPRSTTKPCVLTGNNLFLVTAIGANPEMANAVDVPPEFAGNTLTVPNIARAGANGTAGSLYLRLRDDPNTVQALNLPVVSTGPYPSAPEKTPTTATPAESGGNASSGTNTTGGTSPGGVQAANQTQTVPGKSDPAAKPASSPQR